MSFYSIVLPTKYFLSTNHLFADHGTFKWFCWSVHRGKGCVLFYINTCKVFGVYITSPVLQAIIKKRPSRNINVQNFWLYVFGMVFNVIAIFVQDFDAVMNKYVLCSLLSLYLMTLLSLAFSLLSASN